MVLQSVGWPTDNRKGRRLPTQVAGAAVIMAKTSGISQDKILEVAEAIISVKGVKDTSLKDIAKAVGISKGTLYYHYATKEALLYDITGRHFDEVIRRLLKMAGRKSPKLGVEELLTLMLDEVGEARQISRLHLSLLNEGLSGDEAARAKYTERYREWEKSVNSMLERLFGAEHQAHAVAASLLLTFVEGNAVRGALLDESGPYRDMAALIVGLYEREGITDVKKAD